MWFVSWCQYYPLIRFCMESRIGQLLVQLFCQFLCLCRPEIIRQIVAIAKTNVIVTVNYWWRKKRSKNTKWTKNYDIHVSITNHNFVKDFHSRVALPCFWGPYIFHLANSPVLIYFKMRKTNKNDVQSTNCSFFPYQRTSNFCVPWNILQTNIYTQILISSLKSNVFVIVL